MHIVICQGTTSQVKDRRSKNEKLMQTAVGVGAVKPKGVRNKRYPSVVQDNRLFDVLSNSYPHVPVSD